MTRRTAIILVVLLAVLGLIFLWQYYHNKNKTNQTAISSVTAFNQTKNSDATVVSATPGDIVVFALNAENQNDKVIPGYVIEVNISDVNELATLTDAEGANYNSATNSLIWTPLDIPAKDSIQKKFTVKVKDAFPADSDLVMKVRFNNEVAVSVLRGKPVTEVPATIQPGPGSSPGDTNNSSGSNTGKTAGKSYVSPKTGPSSDLSFILALVSTAGIFTFRLKKRKTA
ncbi:MAG TPA: hypothetical protein VGQ87_00430 [Patescibacteria group bacterium]|jgi:hypothetical protein|nr:hypothetical protein [Patescibacteria group bacterium]